MVKRDLGNGYYAVPLESVTLNRLPLTQLNTANEPYHGPFAVVMPDTGKAAEDEDFRPYRYGNIEEAIEDVARMIRVR